MSNLVYNERYRAKHSETLHVITAISNPQRYHTRYALYDRFADMCKKAGATLWTVETAYGNRHHNITEPDNPYHIQLRTEHELWHKENMLNIAISRLPSNWKYVAWIDADVEFARKDWIDETIQMLQHHMVVQMWSNCVDLLHNYEVNQYHISFMKCYNDWIHGYLPEEPGGDSYGGPRGVYWHAGFAWAARREAIDHLGGLIDWSVCGANDHHMALALVGRLKKSIHGKCSGAFKTSMDEWEARALKYIQKNVGFVPGTIFHQWHGAKTNRQYKNRWNIMIDSEYDPLTDLKKDWQGLYQLTDRRGEKSILLRDGLREYFRSRNEDSIDANPSERTIKPMMVRVEQTPLHVPAKTVDEASAPVGDGPR